MDAAAAWLQAQGVEEKAKDMKGSAVLCGLGVCVCVDLCSEFSPLRGVRCGSPWC